MRPAIRWFVALALLMSAVSRGKVITVDSGGSGDFATIQAAADTAGDGDTVEIKPGTYTGTGNWDIDVRGKAITIRSVDPNDSAVVDATILDCGGLHQAFCLIGQAPTVTLAGLTIANAHSVNGGAVKCLGFVTVSRCHILNCSAGRGGAIYCSGLWDDESLGYPSDGDGATVRVLDCRIEHNTAEMGGGVFASSDSLLVKGCTIDHNRALSNGGGIAGDFTVADTENNTIRGNRAGREGGGIYLRETAATVADSWLAGNWAARCGGALAVRNTPYLETPKVLIRGSTLVDNVTDGQAGGLFLQPPESGEGPGIYGLINSSILWQNADRTGSGPAAQILGPAQVMYSCIQGIDAGIFGDSHHNMPYDPLLVRLPNDGGDGWGDDPNTPAVDESTNDDFGDPHLQGSWCIRSGDPYARISLWATDIDGQPRKVDSAVDVGVDEYCAWGIVILHPRGGEILTGGTTQDVVWQCSNPQRRFSLEFSTSSGGPWQILDANAPSSGRFAWQVPQDVQSDTCRIRVRTMVEPGSTEEGQCEPFSIQPTGFHDDIVSRWRTGGADLQRTGQSRDAGPTEGCLRWQFEARAAITCAPVVGLHGRIHLATGDGQVCTLDARGKLLWACDVHDAVWGSPTVTDDGTLYVSTSSGRVHEITPDGLLRRSYRISPADDSAAVLPNGTLALGSGILDLSTRRFLDFWTDDLTMTFASPAVGSDGTVYAVAWDLRGLHAFDPDTGAQKWSFVSESQGRSFAGPVVGDNGLVYQTCIDDSHVYAVDARTGVLAWRTDLADPCSVTSDRNLLGVESWSEPVLGPEGTIYAGLDDPFIRAIDPTTGRIRWVARMGSGRGFTMAVDSRGNVYAASEDGCLYVVDATGRLVSRFDSGMPLGCPVIASEGLLLVVGEMGDSLDDAADVLHAIAADPGCTSPVLRDPTGLGRR